MKVGVMRCLESSLLLAVLCCLVSCNSKGSKTMGSLKGTVSVKGKAIEEGVINLHSAATGAAASATISSGSFTIEEVQVGTYKVWITPPQQAIPKQGEPPPKMKKIKVPHKYRDQMSTDLTVEITEGENSKDFDLK